MSARLLLEVALRILGFWFFFTAITSLAATGTLMTVGLFSSDSPWPASMVAANLLGSVIRFLIGGVLIWWAPRAAARLYPTAVEDEKPAMRVGPGDIYRTACFVLGVYLLVQVARPATQLIVASAERRPMSSLAPEAVSLVVYAAGGLLLVFGGRAIADMLSNLRYDPETIPKQQISIAVLLIVILLIAIVLGVIRWLVGGGI